jgi:hypothetical protein
MRLPPAHAVRGQVASARIILEDPARYGGGLVQWAWLYIGRHGTRSTDTGDSRLSQPERAEPLPLFQNPACSGTPPEAWQPEPIPEAAARPADRTRGLCGAGGCVPR